MEADPSGIANDRGLVRRIEDDQAVLAVGPSRTPMQVPADELPDGCEPPAWVMLDMQLSPPMILGVDEEMTANERAAGTGPS